jgi:hypothetical protein
MFGLHPDLRRYVSMALFASAAVAVAGAVALAAGWPGIPGTTTVPRWAVVIFAVVALLLGYLGLIVVPRWYRRSSRIVSSVEPKACRILLEITSDSESTSLYATVLDMSHPGGRFAVLMPQWSVQPLLGASLDVSVYLAPASQRPVAFRTPRGLLWCMPSWPPGQV